MSQNNSLVSLVAESNNLELMLIESGGEMTPELEQALAFTQENLVAKVDSCSFVLERLEALEEYYKQKAKEYSIVAKQCEAAQERLKDNLAFAMEAMKTDELKGQDFYFKKVASAGSLEITDPKLIPNEFKSLLTTTVIDNKTLKEAALKYDVPGAKLVPGFSIRSYINKETKKPKVKK